MLASLSFYGRSRQDHILRAVAGMPILHVGEDSVILLAGRKK